MKNNLRGSIILLITAIIWGFAFVAQSEGMEKIGPFTFQASRMLLAAIVLFPASCVSYKLKKKQNENVQTEQIVMNIPEKQDPNIVADIVKE